MATSELKALIQLIGRLETTEGRARACRYLAEALSELLSADEVAVWNQGGELIALSSSEQIDTQSPYIQAFSSVYGLIEPD